MIVRDLMNPDPITITRDASIPDAIALMKENAIRHLPVTAGSKTLEGLVTLADLKQGLIPSMVADLSLSDLVIQDPVTVKPDDDIEMAARLIYHHKISGMPVVHNRRLVGIITETDILRAFIDMMGILTSTSRIDVAVGDTPGAFNHVLNILNESGADIINVGVAARQAGRRIYYFRLSPCRIEPIKQNLISEGFEVLQAID